MDYDKIDKAIDDLDKTSKELKSFSNLYSDLSNLHSSVEKNNIFFNEVTSKINGISISVDKSLVDLRVFTKDIEKSLKDFKSLIVDIDSTLTSRLDRYKSDIQVDLRNECQKLQVKNDEFAKLASEKFDKVDSCIGKVKVYVIINAILSTINISLFAFLAYNFFKV